MRIVAGKYRSRRLKSLRGLFLRPTSDRLRETLFNILGRTVETAVFVDVYAGSGAVGIEALSRGARQAIFIEKNAAAVAVIRSNLQSLGISVGTPRRGTVGAVEAEILSMDAVAAMERLASRGTRAEFVFVDPPYADKDAYYDVIDCLHASPLLTGHGLLILEHSKRVDFPEWLDNLERVRVVEQGDAALSFYRLALAA